MIDNIYSRDRLTGQYRKKVKKFDFKAVHRADLDRYLEEGWSYSKKLSVSVQVKREKPHGRALEDRVWCLLYRMGFEYLTGEGGGILSINSNPEKPITNQIDIIAVDKEVALVIECKSAKEYRKRPEFQEELAKFSLTKECFVRTIKNQLSNNNLKVVYIMFLSKTILTDNDKERAKREKIILFDDKDLTYYENLVAHLGPAAKYQVLADMLPGKEIAGLTIKIPAIKAKMGGQNCYTFSISPEYLLKISYVSHRAKGKASDINTYQRMLSKSRLNKIKEYISDDGIFPTNIILNFEKGRLNFFKSSQKGDAPDNLDIGVLGWLDIRPAYKSAWIIDGQHRLFAYSGHEKALKSKLTVLAFEGLKPSTQAQLFIDINSKQKRVKQSLLQELFAELHWDSEDPTIRISAIISKSIQDLNQDPESALCHRIQTSDGDKDFKTCLTMPTIFGQLEKKGFYITKEKQGSILEYGPLWGGENNLFTVGRTNKVLKIWLNTIAETNREWWNIGSGPGGGLAMNDSVASLISVLKSVFDYLELKGLRLIRLSDQEICEVLIPYAKALGDYLLTFDENHRKAFRDPRGVQGVIFRTKLCQKGIRDRIPEFSPEGLDEWIETQKQQTNKNAKDIIDKVEELLQDYIVSELQREYGVEDDIWWYEGVPQQIRSRVISLMDEDKNKRGGKEYYFELIHYRKIILENWTLFGKVFGYGNKGNAEKKTDWLTFVNERRKIVSHKSSGKIVSIEEYNLLEEYYSWLQNQIQVAVNDTESISGSTLDTNES